MPNLEHVAPRGTVAAPELLWGTDAIGAAVNLKPRQVRHQIAQGRLPARKVGRLWVGERGELLSAVLGIKD